MNRPFSIASGLSILLCTIAATAQSAPASQEYVEPATVPAAIALSAGQISVLRVHAFGYQVYQCSMVSGAPAWTLTGPDANLFDGKQNSMGTHFAKAGSPSWRLNDGSQISGKKTASAPAPDASAIPWLLLTVVSHSGKAGRLTPVTTVQRVNTSGGAAPATGCDATSQGRTTKSPYSADYYFSK